MKEVLLLIRTAGDCADEMSPELYQAHFKKVVDYIDNLSAAGKLISAQPLAMKGSILQGKGASFKDGPFVETKEVIAGYFLLRAADFAEARDMAMAHPILEDDPVARIELREIKRETGINC
ncbi:MAG: YciI family protein [Bacteroidota bacterium]|nr:YciI family protein [Bacteroidota bacterium]